MIEQNYIVKGFNIRLILYSGTSLRVFENQLEHYYLI